MSGDLPKRRTMSIEEVTVFNMWEIPVIVEVLERLRGSLRWGSGWRRARRTNKKAAMGLRHVNWKTSS